MADATQPRVLLVAADADLAASTTASLEQRGFLAAAIQETAAALEAVYANPPDCILVQHEGPVSDKNPLLAELKADNVYGHLPIVLIVTDEGLRAGVDWDVNEADDFLVHPFSGEEVAARVRLCIERAQRDVNANPLTGLPGNLTIMREADHRIAAGQPFAMAYLDIDNFKPFNDKYGFSRGDEVLRMTARILLNAIHSLDTTDTYIGHIGGDDFIFMVPPTHVARVCKRIAQDFDTIVPDFYDEDDRAAGTIESIDRRGEVQTFPLMTISLAVIDTSAVTVSHMADLSSRAAEVKHFTKHLQGSNFIIDRRK